MTIGERIKKLRVELNLSQSLLAKKCGCYKVKHTKDKKKYYNRGQVRISSYECNRKTPPAHIIIALAKALKTSAGYLLAEENNPNNTKGIDNLK